MSHAPSCNEGCSYTHIPVITALLDLRTGENGNDTVALEKFKQALTELTEGGWQQNQNVPDPDTKLQLPLLHLACMFGKYSALNWLVNEAAFDPKIDSLAGKSPENVVLTMLRCLPMYIDKRDMGGYEASNAEPCDHYITVFKELMEILAPKEPTLLCSSSVDGNTVYHFVTNLMVHGLPGSASPCLDAFYSSALIIMTDLLQRLVQEGKVTQDEAVGFILTRNQQGDTVFDMLAKASVNIYSFKALIHLLKTFSDCEQIRNAKNQEGKTVLDLVREHSAGNELLLLVSKSNVPGEEDEHPNGKGMGNIPSTLPGTVDRNETNGNGRDPGETFTLQPGPDNLTSVTENTSNAYVAAEHNRSAFTDLSTGITENDRNKNATCGPDPDESCGDMFNLAHIAAQFVGLGTETGEETGHDNLHDLQVKISNVVSIEATEPTLATSYSTCIIHTPESGLGPCTADCQAVQRHLQSIANTHTPLCQKDCSIQHHALTCMLFAVSMRASFYSNKSPFQEQIDAPVAFKLILQTCLNAGWVEDSNVPDVLEGLCRPFAHLATLSGLPDLLHYVISRPGTAIISQDSHETPMHFLFRNVHVSYAAKVDIFIKVLEVLLHFDLNMLFVKEKLHEQTALHYIGLSLSEAWESCNSDEQYAVQRDSICEILHHLLKALYQLSSDGRLSLTQIHGLLNAKDIFNQSLTDLLMEHVDDKKVERAISLLMGFPKSLEDKALNRDFFPKPELQYYVAGGGSGSNLPENSSPISFVNNQRAFLKQTLGGVDKPRQSKRLVTSSPKRPWLDLLSKKQRLHAEGSAGNRLSTQERIDQELSLNSQTLQEGGEEAVSSGDTPDGSASPSDSPDLQVVHLYSEPQVQIDSPEEFPRGELPLPIIGSEPMLDQTPSCVNPNNSCPCQECRQQRLNEVTRPLMGSADPYKQAMKSRKLKEPAPSTTPAIFMARKEEKSDKVRAEEEKLRQAAERLRQEKRQLGYAGQPHVNRSDSYVKKRKQLTRNQLQYKKKAKRGDESTESTDTASECSDKESEEEGKDEESEEQGSEEEEESDDDYEKEHGEEDSETSEDNSVQSEEEEEVKHKLATNAAVKTVKGRTKQLVVWEQVVEEDPDIKIPEHTEYCPQGCRCRHSHILLCMLATNMVSIKHGQKQSRATLEPTKRMLLRRVKELADNGWDYQSEVNDPLPSLCLPLVHLTAGFNKFETLRCLFLAGFNPYVLAKKSGGNCMHTLLTQFIPDSALFLQNRTTYMNYSSRFQCTTKLLDVFTKCKLFLVELFRRRDPNNDMPLHCAAKRLVSAPEGSRLYVQYRAFLMVAVHKVGLHCRDADKQPDEGLLQSLFLAPDKNGNTFLEILKGLPVTPDICKELVYKNPSPLLARHVQGLLSRHHFILCLPLRVRPAMGVTQEDYQREKDREKMDQKGEQIKHEPEGEEEKGQGEEEEETQERKQGEENKRKEVKGEEERRQEAEKGEEKGQTDPVEEQHTETDSKPVTRYQKNHGNLVQSNNIDPTNSESSPATGVSMETKPRSVKKDKKRRKGKIHRSVGRPRKRKIKPPVKRRTANIKKEIDIQPEVEDAEKKEEEETSEAEEVPVIRRSKRQACKIQETGKQPTYNFSKKFRLEVDASLEKRVDVSKSLPPPLAVSGSSVKQVSNPIVSTTQTPLVIKQGDKTFLAMVPNTTKMVLIPNASGASTVLSVLPTSFSTSTPAAPGPRLTQFRSLAPKPASMQVPIVPYTVPPVPQVPGAPLMLRPSIHSTRQQALAPSTLITTPRVPFTNPAMTVASASGIMGSTITPASYTKPMPISVAITSTTKSSATANGKRASAFPAAHTRDSGVTPRVHSTLPSTAGSRSSACPDFEGILKRQLGIGEKWRIVDTCKSDDARTKRIKKLKNKNRLDRQELRDLERQRDQIDVQISNLMKRIGGRKRDIEKLRLMADRRAATFKPK